MVYFCKPGEKSAPEAVQREFITVVQAIQAGFKIIKPGLQGIEVEAADRRVLIGAGYPEY